VSDNCGTAVFRPVAGDADPAGLAVTDEDDPLAAEPANLAGALIRYARVSTSGQNLDRQARALIGAGCIRIFAGKQPGKTVGRPELAARLDYLRAGDTLVVPSLDRLSRSLPDLITIVAGLRRRGTGFRSLHEALDTTTPGGRLVFHVFAALAKFIPDSSCRGPRCSTPRPGSTARQRRCWPGLPRTGRPGPRRSRRPAPGARCRRRPRSHATSDARFSGWYGGRPRHSLICCWMTSGAGRASTV
jgi:Resolvase, N terminal domain